jgi:hypothetical protein
VKAIILEEPGKFKNIAVEFHQTEGWRSLLEN